MNWYKIAKSLTKYSEAYGFWLSPEGSLYEVNYQDHWNKAVEILDSIGKLKGDASDYDVIELTTNVPSSYRDPLEQMFDLGWARIVVQRGLSVQHERVLTHRQINTIKELAIDYHYLHGNYIHNTCINNQCPSDLRSFNMALRGILSV